MNPTPRELDTILAALRWWQARDISETVSQAARRTEACNIIASEHGAPLDPAEIDRLCERLNAGEPNPLLTPLREALVLMPLGAAGRAEWFARSAAIIRETQ